MTHRPRFLPRLMLTSFGLAAAVASLAAEAPSPPASETTAAPKAAPKASGVKPTLANGPYGRHESQVLDFYQPASGKPTPLAFYIHGGGWIQGEKGGFNVAPFLAEGISVVAIQYRFVAQAEADGLKPPVKGPLGDAARAL